MLRTPSPTPGSVRDLSHGREALGLVAVLCGFLVLPDGSLPQTVAFCLLGLAAAAIAWRRSRGSRHGLAWRFMAAGVAGNALGSLVEMLLARVWHSDAFPSLADVFYLALYPGVGIGLALLVKRASGGALRASILDSGTIAAGAGLLSWILLIHPLTDNPDLDLAGRAVSVAYPLADLILLAIVTRLLLVTSLRSVAHRLVFAAVLCFLLVDTTWGLINHAGWELSPWSNKALQVTVLAAYGLVAMAAAHPTADDAPRENQVLSPRLRPPMLAALTLAALTAPAVLAVQAARGNVTEGAAVAVGSAVSFLLVIARMAGLLGQVERQAALLRELALVDELTGLANRRALMADLARSCEQSQRAGSTLALAVLDLDHFKEFNDLFGHVEGDRLLAAAARAWRGRLRGSDLLARYGGEEFVVVMPATDLETAGRVLQDLRAVTPAGLSFSGGLATWRVHETCDALITRADDALYAAKAQGRDRVVLAEEHGWPRVAGGGRSADGRSDLRTN
jgi:diguanylate cyclase (GGDEF)-like protein